MKNLAVYFFLILFAFLLDDPFVTCLLTIGIVAIYLIGRVDIIKREGVDPMTIYALFSLAVTASNAQLVWKHQSGMSLSAYYYYKPEHGQLAALVWAVSLVFIFTGFDAWKAKNQKKLQLVFTRLSNYWLLFYVSIGLLLSRYFYAIRFLGSITDFIYLIPLLSIFYLGRIGYHYENKTIQNMAYVITILATFLALLFSYLRSDFILPLLMFAIAAFLGKKKMSVFMTAKFYPIIGFFVLFIVFFSQLGETRGRVSAGWGRFTEMVSMTTEQQAETSADEFTVFQRIGVIAQISNAVDLAEQSPENAKESVAPLFTALIPRFLWPEKPKIALGVWFALKMGLAVERDDWYNNSINMTIPGHLYLAFGFIGVIIGSFLFGRMILFFWAAADYTNVRNFGGTILYGYLMYLAINGFGADLQIVVTMIATYALIYVSSVFFNARNEITLSRSHVAGK